MRFGSLLFSFLFLNLRFVLHPHWGEEYIRVGEYEYIPIINAHQSLVIVRIFLVSLVLSRYVSPH